MLQERELPQNIEAEQSVLGAMLIDKSAVALLSEQLKAEDFYRQAHRVIFQAMLALYSRTEPIDMVTVIDELKRINRAMYHLGILYSQGRGVQQNHSEACRWYMKSAELGDVEAMLKLGSAYENGLGVDYNYGEAFRWYMKAAGTGHGRGVEGLSKAERLLIKNLNASTPVFKMFCSPKLLK